MKSTDTRPSLKQIDLRSVEGDPDEEEKKSSSMASHRERAEAPPDSVLRCGDVFNNLVENEVPMHDDTFSLPLVPARGLEDEIFEPPECMRLVCKHLREIGGDVLFGYNDEKDVLIYNKNRMLLPI